MGLVRGENVLLSIPAIGGGGVGGYEPIGCARSITINVENELIETSITGSGKYRTYVPGAKTYTGTLEGLVLLTQNSSDLSGLSQLYYFMDQVVAFHFHYEMTDGNLTFFREGGFFIESITETSSFDNMATFTVNFRGSETLYRSLY